VILLQVQTAESAVAPECASNFEWLRSVDVGGQMTDFMEDPPLMAPKGIQWVDKLNNPENGL
jgi:hypothetical protein